MHYALIGTVAFIIVVNDKFEDKMNYDYERIYNRQWRN